MDYRINEFKKFLIDEVRSKSFKSYSEIIWEVQSFSKTGEFSEAFRKWLTINPKNRAAGGRPKHVMG